MQSGVSVVDAPTWAADTSAAECTSAAESARACAGTCPTRSAVVKERGECAPGALLAPRGFPPAWEWVWAARRRGEARRGEARRAKGQRRYVDASAWHWWTTASCKAKCEKRCLMAFVCLLLALRVCAFAVVPLLACLRVRTWRPLLLAPHHRSDSRASAESKPAQSLWVPPPALTNEQRRLRRLGLSPRACGCVMRVRACVRAGECVRACVHARV